VFVVGVAHDEPITDPLAGTLGAPAAEIVVLSYSNAGALRWSRATGCTDGSALVAADGQGRVFIAGSFWHLLDLGQHKHEDPPLTATRRHFVAGLDAADGSSSWLKLIEELKSKLKLHDLLMGPKGELVPVGGFWDEVDLGR
jgi:hypothetical protein